MEPSKWLSFMPRKRRSGFHPIYHVLFGMLLDELPHVPRQELFGAGPWTCLNPMAEHYGQQVVTDLVTNERRNAEKKVRKIGRFSCSCGYVYRQSSDENAKTYVICLGSAFEERMRVLLAEGNGLRAIAGILGVYTSTVRHHASRLGLITPWKGQRAPRVQVDPQAAVRDRWISLQQKEPEISRHDLSRRLQKEYRWLLRYDRVWLQAHSPGITVIGGRQRTDWRAVDLDLVSAITKAAETVRVETPPCRITMAELERRVRKSNWISLRRKHLPETMAVLGNLIEPISDFRKRQIAWAVAKFRDTGATSIWKFLKSTGITNVTKKEIDATLADFALMQRLP